MKLDKSVYSCQAKVGLSNSKYEKLDHTRNVTIAKMNVTEITRLFLLNSLDRYLVLTVLAIYYYLVYTT